MSGHFETIYASKAELYDELVSHEDFMQNLTNALLTIRRFTGSKVVEFGAGTGRLTRWLSVQSQDVVAFELYAHMLETLGKTLTRPALYAIADNHAMPVPNGFADIAIAGWTFGHAIGWYPENWREHIQQMCGEMRRVVRDDGTMIIIETLGTGYTTPTPPNEGLAEYYVWLKEQGFLRRWIRSDYRFESVDDAERLIRFFFGDELGDYVRARNLFIVPECTGIWWKHV